MILKVYADESFTKKAYTLCGFIASSDYWKRFEQKWNAVLKKYGLKYFHFREFVDKENRWKIKNNPFLKLNDEERDRLPLDLSIVLCEEAALVGSILDIAKFNQEEIGCDCHELLIAKFYAHFGQKLSDYWPQFTGQVLFVFDENENEKWIGALNKVHKKAQKVDCRIGGLSFENDLRCPPLQAADLYAYAGRQNTERYYAQDRTRQVKRTLDWILSRTTSPLFRNQLSYVEWLKLVRLVLADRKMKKRIWANQGHPKRQYYPELDFKPEEHGNLYRRIDLDICDDKK